MLIFVNIYLQLFPPMVIMFELYTCVWFFAAVSLLGLVVAILFITETKGKNLLDEISG